MFDFEKTILHILDTEHNVCLLSDMCMEVHEDQEALLQSKLTKIFTSAKRKESTFKDDAVFKKWLMDFKEERISFEELSAFIAQSIYDGKMKYGLYASSDFIFCLLVHEGRRYVVGIDNAYHAGVTHAIQHETACNVLCKNTSLLSSNLVKEDRVFIVELHDFSTSCIETSVDIEGEKHYFFADMILHSITKPSYKEAVGTITKTAESIVDTYDMDALDVMPKAKRMIKEHVEEQTPIHVEEMAEQLFQGQPLAKSDFMEGLKSQGVQQEVSVEFVKPTKAGVVQKIKTDKGIELIIPVDYMNAKDLVEFKNQPDGTISIQLNNILHFSSK